MPYKSDFLLKYTPNRLYPFLSPRLKVALCVLGCGLSIRAKGQLGYDPSRVSWFSRVVAELDGIVSRVTIDRSLDSLLDGSILTHGENEMTLVVDGGQPKWVRAYHVTNEFSGKLIQLFELTHDRH